jgi:phytoene dehydrogenase-like protein
METYDALVIGSGHNALVTAAYLARAGRSVLVLERNDRPGGLVRTDELTLPDFKHDVYSAAHPLFLTGPAYADLAAELGERGQPSHRTAIPNLYTVGAATWPGHGVNGGSGYIVAQQLLRQPA